MGTVEILKRFIESNSVVEKVVKEIIERLPLRFRFGISYGPTFRYWLAFLKESENWDRDEIEAYQVEQLSDLLIHAGNNVPYYRKIFAEYGFRPEKIQGLDDIKILPFIDRKIVKERQKEFISEDIPHYRLIPARTSGTSGIPLIIYGTKETEEKHWATIVNLWSRVGYSPVSRAIFIESNIRSGKKGNIPYKKFGNRIIISSNYFIDKWVERYVDMINAFRPEFIIALPSALSAFASRVRKIKKDITDSLECVILYSENVYPWQREIIGKVFGVRVFADYGMVEKVIHGGSCELSDTYHICPQYGYTEYLYKDSMCELVGTGFINYAMPLIRYRTGDNARIIACQCPLCERNHDIIEVNGRTGDFLIDSDGHVVSVYLDINLKALEGIEKFQLHQEKPGNVELKIWPQENFRNENINILLNEIKKNFGNFSNSIRFDLTVMEESPTLTYKYKMIDQKLDIRNFLK